MVDEDLVTEQDDVVENTAEADAKVENLKSYLNQMLNELENL